MTPRRRLASKLGDSPSGVRLGSASIKTLSSHETDTVVREYEQQGFAYLRNMFSTEELASLAAALDDGAAPGSHKLGTLDVVDIGPSQGTDPEADGLGQGYDTEPANPG